MGIGFFAIRNSSGDILGAGVERFPAKFVVDVAQAIAVRQALLFTTNMHGFLQGPKLDALCFGIVIEDCIFIEFVDLYLLT